jgi:hypothetical protein
MTNKYTLNEVLWLFDSIITSDTVAKIAIELSDEANIFNTSVVPVLQ